MLLRTKFRAIKRCISKDFPWNNNECILKRQYDYQVIKIMKQYQLKTDVQQIVTQYALIQKCLCKLFPVVVVLHLTLLDYYNDVPEPCNLFTHNEKCGADC